MDMTDTHDRYNALKMMLRPMSIDLDNGMFPGKRRGSETK